MVAAFPHYSRHARCCCALRAIANPRDDRDDGPGRTGVGLVHPRARAGGRWA